MIKHLPSSWCMAYSHCIVVIISQSKVGIEGSRWGDRIGIGKSHCLCVLLYTSAGQGRAGQGIKRRWRQVFERRSVTCWWAVPPFIYSTPCVHLSMCIFSFLVDALRAWRASLHRPELIPISQSLDQFWWPNNSIEITKKKFTRNGGVIFYWPGARVRGWREFIIGYSFQQTMTLMERSEPQTAIWNYIKKAEEDRGRSQPNLLFFFFLFFQFLNVFLFSFLKCFTVGHKRGTQSHANTISFKEICHLSKNHRHRRPHPSSSSCLCNSRSLSCWGLNK